MDLRTWPHLSLCHSQWKIGTLPHPSLLKLKDLLGRVAQKQRLPTPCSPCSPDLSPYLLMWRALNSAGVHALAKRMTWKQCSSFSLQKTRWKSPDPRELLLSPVLPPPANSFHVSSVSCCFLMLTPLPHLCWVGRIIALGTPYWVQLIECAQQTVRVVAATVITIEQENLITAGQEPPPAYPPSSSTWLRTSEWLWRSWPGRASCCK